jgi:hypothetical protein
LSKAVESNGEGGKTLGGGENRKLEAESSEDKGKRFKAKGAMTKKPATNDEQPTTDN